MKKILEIDDIKILAKKKLPKMFYDYKRNRNAKQSCLIIMKVHYFIWSEAIFGFKCET